MQGMRCPSLWEPERQGMLYGVMRWSRDGDRDGGSHIILPSAMASGFWSGDLLEVSTEVLSLRGLRPRRAQRCRADPASPQQPGNLGIWRSAPYGQVAGQRHIGGHLCRTDDLPGLNINKGQGWLFTFQSNLHPGCDLRAPGRVAVT